MRLPRISRRTETNVPKQLIITHEVDADEDQTPEEFNSFDEAYASLMAQLEPGGSIDLHEEHCALVVDEPECNCTPMRIVKGASA